MTRNDSQKVAARRRFPTAILTAIALAGLTSWSAAPAAAQGSSLWAQQAELTPSDSAIEFGSSVAISGNTAVVGAPGSTVGGNSRQGAAYIFVNNGGVWTQQAELTAADGAANNLFGGSVSISGNTVVIGAEGLAVNGAADQGAAYVFVNNGGSWTQAAELTASDGAAYDDFGGSVSVNAGTLVVGAPTKTLNGNQEQGAAYVFANSGGTWTQQAELIANDGLAGDVFGLSVSGDANNIVVGAPNKRVSSLAQGVAYVFTQNNGAWSQYTEFIAPDGGPGSGFGTSVALDGATAIIGAPNDDGDTPGMGSVYVYQLNFGTWSNSAELLASDAAANDSFGRSVALDSTSGRFAVGAPNNIASNNAQGAAYAFALIGGAWTQQAETRASDETSAGYYGGSVAVSGTTMLVGAKEIPVGSGRGAAYIVAEVPAQLQIVQQPSDGTVASAIGNVLVQLEDASGNPLSTNGTPVTIASTPAGVTGTLTVNTANGVAAFGDLTFSAANSYTLTVTSPGLASATSASIQISQLTQTISIDYNVLPNQVLGVAPFAITASASSGLPVSFASLTNTVCTMSGNILTMIAVGQCTIEVTQAGNAEYAAATPVDESFQVAAAQLQSQTIDFPTQHERTLGIAPFAIPVTATSGLPVTLTSLNPAVCSVSGNTVSLLSAGLCQLEATQPGNAQYAAATPVDRHFQVDAPALKSQSINFAPMHDRQLGDVPFAVPVTASSGLPVTLSSLTPSVCSVTGNVVTVLARGTCTLQATQAGDATYAPADPVTRSFSITKRDQTIIFPSITQNFTSKEFLVNVESTSKLKVRLHSKTKSVCTVVDYSHYVKLHSTGTCTLVARQPGDREFAAATPVTQTFVVGRGDQTITFDPIPDQGFNGKPLAIPLTATASSDLTVEFTSRTPAVCGVVTNATTGNVEAVLRAAGECTIEARQPGNADFLPATPVEEGFQVGQ